MVCLLLALTRFYAILNDMNNNQGGPMNFETHVPFVQENDQANNEPGSFPEVHEHSILREDASVTSVEGHKAKEQISIELVHIENRLAELGEEYTHLRDVQNEARFSTLRGSITLREKYLQNSEAVRAEISRARFLCSDLQEDSILERLNSITPLHRSLEEDRLEGILLSVLRLLPTTNPDGIECRSDDPSMHEVETAFAPLAQALKGVWGREAEYVSAYHDYQSGLPQEQREERGKPYSSSNNTAELSSEGE